MILGDLFESDMKRVMDTVQDFVELTDKEFIARHGVSPVAWVKQNQSLLSSIADQYPAIKKYIPAPDAHLFQEDAMVENLRKWFKEKWVRFGPDGKIRGACARGSKSEGKPKCLPQAKAHALGKKGRASAAAKKRREDPNPERRGKARNVATRVKEQHDWDDADEFGMPGSEFFPDEIELRSGDYVRDRQDGEHGEIFRMSGDPSERRVQILDRDGRGWYISPDRLVAVDRNDPDIMKYFGKRRHRDMDETTGQTRTVYRVIYNGRPIDILINNLQQAQMVAQRLEQKYGGKARVDHTVDVPKELSEKQDACYHKVKARYKVWPSAYASGALVQCRKKGAANWGKGSKKK